MSEQFKLPKMGVGTMLWLNDKENMQEIFDACIENGLIFFDTAEIYGNGASEKILGKCIRNSKTKKIFIADKFAPPSKMNPLTQKRMKFDSDDPRALLEALNDSLERLQIDTIDLYQMHMPPKNDCIEEYMFYMAQAIREGKIRSVGVCNFNAEQIRRASTALKKEGFFLTSAMVGYNIIRRYPETNGIFDECEKENISIIPYAPLAEGILTGKYREGKRIPLKYAITTYWGHLDLTKERDDGVSLVKRIFSKPRELDIKNMEPLMDVLEEIAKKHNKTIAQVSINWLMAQTRVNIVPIPGMRTIRQVIDNASAMDWTLTEDEIMQINKIEERTRKKV